jgi:PmbA protein
LGLQPNGYAGRGGVGASGVGVSNLRVAPGSDDLAGLMAQAGSGLMVTGMFSPSLNPNTGEWSAGVHGTWFDAGEPAFPVSEVTVAGSLPEFYARLIAGSDVTKLGAAMTPSLMVDAVAIGGV